MISRRGFIGAAAVVSAGAPLALSAGAKVPVGLELFSVRDELMKDLNGTLRAVAKMGYEVVEFYAPYFDWTLAQAKEVRMVLDDLGIKCNSTHNNSQSFTADGLPKAIDLNRILGTKYIVMASPGRVESIDAWKKVAEQLTKASEQLKPLSLRAGYHNHDYEWPLMEGKRPMDVIADNTPHDFMLQLDVGTCVAMGVDPVAWIDAHPGRINSLHCKDWAKGAGPEAGYRALFGEGDAPWAGIFAAAESVGGVEYYLIEQEGSRYSEFETAERCLATWKKMRG